MSENYINDIKRYRPDVNEQAVAAIIKHLGIALKSPDASLVSSSSSSELARVRDSWLKKKLGLTTDDQALDKAILEVCNSIPGEAKKNRVTVYYLLAEKLGKLGMLAGTKSG
jgi:hypothetical protein